MKTIIATTLALATLAAVPLIAQTGAPQAEARSAKHAERFKAADTSRDGALSRAEWDAMQRTNDRFARMDTNKDGKLTEAEMQAMHKGGRHGEKRGDPAAFFAGADTNKDGAISTAEWEAAGRKPEGFARMDADKDGKVSQAEMDAAVAQMKARRAGTARL